MANHYETVREGICKKIEDAAAARGSRVVSASKTDLDSMAHAMMNTPEHTVNIYDMRGDVPTFEECKPVERYRESLIPLMRSMGIDKHDADRVKEIPFTKEHCSAAVDVVTHVMHDYMVAGRKLTMPVTSEGEAAMQLSAYRAPERESVNRFSTTSSTTVTKERIVAKATNKVPKWLKEKK